MSSASSTMSATIYIRNLEERIKVEQLKEALMELFSEYGEILEIIAKTNIKARGQAFIVFANASSAQRAIDEVQGFDLFDKPMQLAFAKTRSDATVRRHGSDEEYELHKRRRLAEKDKKKAAEAAEETKRLKRSATAVGSGGSNSDVSGRPTKAPRGTGLKSSHPTGGAVVPDEYLPPNKTLFVQNVPEDSDVERLTSIFGRFEGFREVRLVPGRRGIAFVEYETEAGAIAAKENTAGMVLGDGSQTIKVTYQRQ